MSLSYYLMHIALRRNGVKLKTKYKSTMVVSWTDKKTQGDPPAGQGGVRREESVRQVLQRAGSSQDSERGHSSR
jgi:hypothetical protein